MHEARFLAPWRGSSIRHDASGDSALNPAPPAAARTRTRRAPRRWWSAILAVLAALLCASSAAAQGKGYNGWPGLYQLDRTLTFYVVNSETANFTVTIRYLNPHQNAGDRPLLVRVYDPQEQLLTRHLHPGLRVSGSPTWTEFDMPVTANLPGVYQVIVTGLGGTVHFDLTPDLPWGVFGYPELRGTAHLNEAYIYLPPGLSQLNVRCSGSIGYLRLADESDVIHLNLAGTNPSGFCALPAGEDRIWRLTAQTTGEVGVNFGGAPIILCPDEATALSIRSSVDVLEDGTICFHKFQVTAHAILQDYRAMPVGSFTVNPPSLASATSDWVSEPIRNILLLGPYGVVAALPAALSEQNVDPESPWFGSIYVWHDSAGNERPDNPFARYDRLNLTQAAPTLPLLAAIYSIDEPFNPLRGNANLRNRIIIAALQDLMMIREHELPMSEWTLYDGGDKAFVFSRFTRPLPFVIADCPGNVANVWLDGLGRYVDQMLFAQVPEVANQWASIMIGLRNYAKSRHQDFYHEAVHRQINWLLTRRQGGMGAMPAGYFADGEGPDASYSGILLHHLAWLAEDLDHQPLTSALRESYRLLNHTIAPEPGGTWMGSNAFSHRTPTDWTEPQWGAGVAMMGDNCVDAGALVGRTWIPKRIPRNAAELQQAQIDLQNVLAYHGNDAYSNPDVGYALLLEAPMIHLAAWEHFLTTPKTGQLPMKSSDRFTRKFGAEFLAARRPTYYGMLYSGRTLFEWHHPTAPTSPDVQYPRNGGGLSMFWSPKFGSSILAKNWSAFSANSIIAKKGQQTHFEDYWESSASLQEAQSRATVTGKLTDGRLNFRRRIDFQEDRIVCEIRLHAQQAITYQRLWESFPFSLEKPDAISVTLHDDQGRTIPGNNKIASAIVFRTSVNEVHVVAFSEPRRCEVGSHTSTDSQNHQRTCGTVLTQLPNAWNAGQARMLKWSIKAVRPNQVQATVKQMVQSLK